MISIIWILIHPLCLNNIPIDKRRFTIYKIILEFISTNNQLKQIINKHINKLPNNDKKYIFECANGSIQNFLFIKKIIDDNSSLKQNSNQTVSMLTFSIYNLLFSKKMPNYAVINSAVELAKKIKLKNHSYINAILRKISRLKDFNYDNYIISSYNKWLYVKLLNPNILQML